MNNYEIVASTILVPVISYLKRRFSLESRETLYLTVVLAVVASFGVSIFEKEVFSIEGLLTSLIKIFAGAQAIYNILKQTPAEKVLR